MQQIATDEQAAAADFAHEHPDIALWRLIRTTLQGDGGASYFDQSMKDAVIPPQTGDFKRVQGEGGIAAESERAAGEISTMPRATRRWCSTRRSTARSMPGLEIEFSGVVESYSKDPFNVG